MVHEVHMGKLRERMSFSRIDEVLEMPNLIEVQKNSYQRFLDTDLREVLADVSPRQTLVNQGNPFKMKGNVTRPADVKRGKLPRKTSGNPYGALAQLVARDIRIVEVRGSTPLCSTQTLEA